jgi:hypothetical protein
MRLSVDGAADHDHIPLRPRIALFATKAMLWASVSKQIDGLWVGCFDKDLSVPVFRRVDEGLELIKQYDPIRYRRLVGDLDRIWITLLPGPLGHYQRELKLCAIDERYVLAEDTTPDLVASVIVHEATHARLERCGIGYDEPLQSRVEAVCFRRELAFANKLPNGLGLRRRATRYLDYYTSEKFTLSARLHRHDKGSAEALRYLGTPEVLIRAAFAIRALASRMKRLGGGAGDR